ncbi:ArsR/SmtB family transcription factor [Streptomyces sp. NPDC020965]|uniref:ArsR/SmtB family transcription factor n=1 Tax=Streptomyces sp. NPDC020965 TaxID=3365105 RepID=UPI003799188B
MQRIHFTVADLGRIRLKNTAGPLVETAFAAGLLGRGIGSPYARWRKQVSKRMPRRPPQLSRSGDHGEVDRVLRQLRPGVGGGLLTPLSAPEPAPWLPEVWRAAVAPYWDRLLGYLEAECEARGRIVMTGGVEQLLTTLHSRIVWTSPVLEIPGGPDEDIRLGGRGLVLTPSVFLNHRPGQLVGDHDGSGQLTLVFAAPPRAHEAATLWEPCDDGAGSLGALVGQTRAAALRELRATCTTSQLADRLGISAAGASQHAAVLRSTGLISTRRVRNTVLHTVTPLGLALLDGGSVHPVRARSVGHRPPLAPCSAVRERRPQQLVRHGP